MRNDGFECNDEVEPRTMPRQASTFNARPIPMVPEVSLILEKQQKTMEDTLSNTMPEPRLNSSQNGSHRIVGGYAAWKAKEYPHFPRTPPQPSHRAHISSCDTRSSQAYFKEIPRNCDSLNCTDLKCRSQFLGEETPNRYSNLKAGPVEIPNKYSPNHIIINKENYLDYIQNHRREEIRSCKADERTGYTQRTHPDHLHAMEPYEYKDKPKIHRSSSCSKADSYFHRTFPGDHEYESRHYRSLQPIHFNNEHSHGQVECCNSHHNNSNAETETVKNLLQVITSQNEQIKNLQKQVERLIKLHEQNMKDRNRCKCQPNGMIYQNAQLYDQSRSANLPIAHKNIMKENERMTDLKLPDEKNKKTILEQKVSIGVMTSFELKVQNNQSLPKDNEVKQKNAQEKVLPTSGTSNILKSLVNDTEEMIRKKPNFFNSPLENISEGSESHMSSLRQSYAGQDSTRQSIEGHDLAVHKEQSPNLQKSGFQENRRMQSPFHNPNFRQYNSRSRNHADVSRDQNAEHIVDMNYESQNQEYKRIDPHMQERESCRYDAYENLTPRVELARKEKSNELDTEPLSKDITKTRTEKCDNFADECLSLSSSELDVEDPSPPSPEPSIHLDQLDMQEYSSETGSLPPQRTNKFGWTIYNNVVDQVNHILQNTAANDEQDEQEYLDGVQNDRRREYENDIMDTVKAATMEQLTKLGISFSDNFEHGEPNTNRRVVFDTSYYAKRPVHEANGVTASASVETNTSMHMKALAMKYLNEDQLADMALQKSRPNIIKQIPSNVANANMSFATMTYLQRYNLFPGTNTNPTREIPREDYKPMNQMMNERRAIRTMERRMPSPHGYAPVSGTSKGSYPSKILDISTLKQQPKLL